MIATALRRLAILLPLLATSAFAQTDFESRLLAAHNAVRAEVGTPPLKWDPRLAASAQAWADVLARKGRLQHDSQRAQGENLWMGSANFYSLEDMVGDWAEERRDYRHGPYPQPVPRGRHVGHYTQIVWRTTRQVGCATARSREMEFLVCRYSPPGNWAGRTAY